MGLVEAKCPNCGMNITVDKDKDAGICEYCGTPFITEKAINNYITNVTNNYEGATINNYTMQDAPEYEHKSFEIPNSRQNEMIGELEKFGFELVTSTAIDSNHSNLVFKRNKKMKNYDKISQLYVEYFGLKNIIKGERPNLEYKTRKKCLVWSIILSVIGISGFFVRGKEVATIAIVILCVAGALFAMYLVPLLKAKKVQSHANQVINNSRTRMREILAEVEELKK